MAFKRRAGVLASPASGESRVGSREDRGPRVRRAEFEGVGEVELRLDTGRLEVDDCEECPRRDCEVLNLESGAPLSDTVSRWVDCVRS